MCVCDSVCVCVCVCLQTAGRAIVLLYLNGLKIVEHEIQGWEMKVKIKKKVAGSCLVHTPGIRVGHAAS